jgi:phosphoglucomutase
VEIKAIRDYEKGIRMEIKNKNERPLGLPSADVLYYETVNGHWFCIRPSGTEPKIKIYYGVSGKSDRSSAESLKNLKTQVLSIIKPMFE